MPTECICISMILLVRSWLYDPQLAQRDQATDHLISRVLVSQLPFARYPGVFTILAFGLWQDTERRQAMSHSISTLLTRNLHDVFGENDSACRRAAIDEIFTEDCVFYEPKGVYRGRDEIDRVARARSRLLTLTFDISRLTFPRNWAMGGGSNGSRAALVRLQLTPGLISSLPRTAGLPLFISFSTSYRELNSAMRRLTRRIGKLRGEDVSRSLKLLCLKRNIENLSTIQERSGYLLGQRGNEQFVG
jgi:hypothetical protein